MNNNHPTKYPQHATSNDANIIREMIRHEDELLDQRLTWLCQIQGFLFTALAFTWKDSTAEHLILLICVVGVLVAVSSYYGLNRAENAIANLRTWWETNKAPDYFGPMVIGLKPDRKLIYFLRPWNFLPGLFSVAWILVACLKITAP